MSEEVKGTIIKNNKLGKVKVYPISINPNDEGSINILNDFAIIHDSNVVTSQMGQTISQEIRKELDKGKEIIINRNSIGIKPVIDLNKINIHRNFLKKRISEAMLKRDVKIDPIEKRLKMFSSKRLNIYIPEIMFKNTKINRELDYCFKFLSNLKHEMQVIFIDDQLFYIPVDYINIANDKMKSLKSNLSNIKVILA
jgi:hypothetical protein